MFKRSKFLIYQALIGIFLFAFATAKSVADSFDRDGYLQSLKRSHIWLDYYPVNYEPSGISSLFNSKRIDVLIAREDKKPIYPKYAIIGMPGGEGLAHIELKPINNQSDSWASGSWHPVREVVQSFWAWGFPERARDLFIDEDFIFVYTDATSNVEKVNALVAQLQKSFPKIQIYIHGISRGTYSSMSLGESLDGKVAGFIHSSAMNVIASYRTDNKKSRHLLVHHRKDACDGTLLASSEINRDRYGTELILIDNDITSDTGDTACGPFTYHGFFMADQQAVDLIKAWVKKSDLSSNY